jgi:cytochrome b561
MGRRVKGLLAMNDVALLAIARTLPIAAACGSGNHRDRTTRVLHWTTLVLLVAVFALAERLLQLHRSVGILIWCITVVSLGRRLLGAADAPPLPNNLSTLQRLAAPLTHHALYAFLTLQPILGILQVRATPAAAQ